jgi:hypothetical protein
MDSNKEIKRKEEFKFIKKSNERMFINLKLNSFLKNSVESNTAKS